MTAKGPPCDRHPNIRLRFFDCLLGELPPDESGNASVPVRHGVPTRIRQVDIMALRDRLRVMVVDDMSTSRGLIAQALDEFGIQNVDMAEDGHAALAVLKDKPADLVISDYHMPAMDGLHLLHILRTNEQTRGMHFILLTGRDDPEILESGKKLRMNGYLTKPFTLAELRAGIETIVGRL